MTGKTKAIIGIAAFVLFIGAAVFAYNTLTTNETPHTNIVQSVTPHTDIAQSDTPQPSIPVPQEEDTMPKDAPPEEEKEQAPDFTVYDGDGNAVKLSDLFGRPIVVNFFASWCPPCKAEMPEFESAYVKYSDSIVFMMVDLVDGQQETKEKGEAYVTKQGFTFPVYYDTAQEAAMRYGISSIPATLFIDAEGYAVTAAVGAISEESLRRGIEQINE